MLLGEKLASSINALSPRADDVAKKQFAHERLAARKKLTAKMIESVIISLTDKILNTETNISEPLDLDFTFLGRRWHGKSFVGKFTETNDELFDEFNELFLWADKNGLEAEFRYIDNGDDSHEAYVAIVRPKKNLLK